MEPVPDNSAPCLSRCLQVQTLHGILRDLFSAAVGRGSPDLPPPQRECPGNHESECQRASPYRRLFLPDLCEFAGWLCLLRNPAGRTATRFTRSEKQCLTSLSLPAVLARRIRGRQNVRGFDSSLEGPRWFVDNLWIASAIFIGSLVWILLLALLSQAISALVKWRVIASGALLGLFFIPAVFGSAINLIFRTRWGNLISPDALMRNVFAGLFGTFERTTSVVTDFDGQIATRVSLTEPPLWSSWAMLFLICAVCLAVLSAKVKAYEV